MKKLARIGCLLLLSVTLNQRVLAEGSGNGGDAFRETAAGYEAKAEKFSGMDMDEIAAMYKKMAEIKVHAARLGDANRWDKIDWTEYHALEQQIAELISKQPHEK